LKKNVVVISSIFIIIIFMCIGAIKINTKANKVISNQNKEYEQYLQNEIYGTDVITLINRAISSNEENNILKDEKGYYINNNKNSIQIDLVMITDEEKGKTTIYKMETISKVGITEFIKNFNTARFKCTKIEYHLQTGRISYIQLVQQYD